MGRTHLQDAVPIRLGQEFAAYAKAIGRDICRIEAASEALNEVNMGATAVGTGLNAKNRERCQAMVDKSVGIITALLPYIGYEKATVLAKEVASAGKTVPEIIAEKNIFTPKEIKKVLSPKAMTEPGIVLDKKIS